MTQLRISAKQLGYLAKENFCPRCFYIGYHLQFKYPGTVFAGILNKLDAIQKKSAVKYHDKFVHLPAWLEQDGIIGTPQPCPGPKNFITTIDDVVLSGSIDLLVRTPQNELIIVDFKTASPKNGYDPFLPVYDIQLQGYAKITQDLGLGKVVGLYLVYFNACTNITADTVTNHVNEENLEVSFKVEVKKSAVDPETKILPLLQTFKQIVLSETIPEKVPGCLECAKFDSIVEFVSRASADMRTKTKKLSGATGGLMVES